MQVFDRLARGISAIEKEVKTAGYEFAYNEHLGFIHRSAADLHAFSQRPQLPDQHRHGHARERARQAAQRLQEQGL